MEAGTYFTRLELEWPRGEVSGETASCPHLDCKHSEPVALREEG